MFRKFSCNKIKSETKQKQKKILIWSEAYDELNKLYIIFVGVTHKLYNLFIEKRNFFFFRKKIYLNIFKKKRTLIYIYIYLFN